MVGIDTNPIVFVLLLILGIESFVAFLGNGFIMAVNGYRWLQSKKVIPSDLPLTALGTTRFLLQLISMTVQLLYVFTSEFFCNNYLWLILFYAWTYFSSASVWCATWLSVFYCVKITNFAHCLFLWLKPRIDVLMPRLLGLSLTVFSLPLFANGITVKNNCSPSGNMTGNTTQREGSDQDAFTIFICLHFTFTVINVSICLTASTLLLISLWRHTRNLKRSGIATKDFNSQAHINVVKSLLSFLFFYILYLFVVTFSLTYTFRLGTVEALVVNAVQALSSSAHSIILILTNPKLKEVFVRVLKIRQRTSKRREDDAYTGIYPG